MARDVIIHQINDWSALNSRDDYGLKLTCQHQNLILEFINSKVVFGAAAMLALVGFTIRMDAICNRPEKNILL